MSNDEQRAITLLDQLVKEFRKESLKEVAPDCNEFAVPVLNLIYIEIYECVKDGLPILALAGAGIFLEDFINLLWVVKQCRREQLKGTFNSWDEFMRFKEIKLKEIEDEEVDYWEIIRPDLKGILGTDLNKIELLRQYIVRHNFIHSKRIYLVELLQKYSLLPKTMPVGRAKVSNGRISEPEKIELGLTHPMVLSVAFKTIAKQIAPAILRFIYQLFRKYHKSFAPLPDKKLGFPPQM